VNPGAGVEIRPVRSRGDLRRFIKFPFRLYRDEPNWVPPLIADRLQFFDIQKNPFYRSADVALFMAWRGTRPVGRIAACVNHDYNEFHQEQSGVFGFFECERDPDAAGALFGTAAAWLKARDQTSMFGPFNFSTNHEVGFLVKGFDSPPAVMMTYTHPYYAELAEAWGMTKVKDLIAYYMHKSSPPAERIRKIAARVRARNKVTIRAIDMEKFEQEIERVRQIYNEAWSKNWGFVPLREEEFAHIARDMKLIVSPELAFVAEADGRPVGFSLALPNVHESQIKIRNGRLFPTGLVRLLWDIKVKKSIRGIRIITMGVVHEYQKRGIESVFYVETFDRASAMGYEWGEISWILEDNDLMIRAAEALGSKPYKTYRIYGKPL
jgi:GNAT superfamily N-acetyltransferase